MKTVKNEMKEKIPNKHTKNHYLLRLFSNDLFEKKEKGEKTEREKVHLIIRK